LRSSSRIRPCKRQQDPDGAKGGKGQKAAQTTGVDRSHVRPQSIRDGTLLVATTSNGGRQGRAAAIQQEKGTLPAHEDNNPAQGSRNLHEHNTTGLFDSDDLDMTVIAALQYSGVHCCRRVDHRWFDQKLRSDESS
jgi:hypothetical protein